MVFKVRPKTKKRRSQPYQGEILKITVSGEKLPSDKIICSFQTFLKRSRENVFRFHFPVFSFCNLLFGYRTSWTDVPFFICYFVLLLGRLFKLHFPKFYQVFISALLFKFPKALSYFPVVHCLSFCPCLMNAISSLISWKRLGP